MDLANERSVYDAELWKQSAKFEDQLAAVDPKSAIDFFRRRRSSRAELHFKSDHFDRRSDEAF